MKKAQNDVVIYAIFAAYIALVVTFAITFFYLPKLILGAEIRHMNNIQMELKEIFEQTPTVELAPKLEQMRNDSKLEISVYQDDKIIYQSIPEISFKSLRGLFTEEMVLNEVQGDILTPFGTYTIWYSILRPTVDFYLKEVVTIQTIFIFIAFIFLLGAIIILRQRMRKPLAAVKAAMNQLENYDFENINLTSDDAVTRSVGRFAINLQDKISVVAQNHTELEHALQLERERLSNMITVSRGIIHDLKSPVHQTLIENDFYLKENNGISTESQTIAEYNIYRMDVIMKQINEVLNLLDTNVKEMTEVAHFFDIVPMFKEIRQSFGVLLHEKKLLLETNAPNQLDAHMNKVTARLIMHNMLSNAVKYAIVDSEIFFDIDIQNGKIILICENTAESKNLNRMKNSEQLFQSIIDEEANEDDAYIYSTGNGLYLIKELARLAGGEYALEINDDTVKVYVVIPQGEGGIN
jgi:Histidine kinase-, DNA gyrase B-, and HSP90-like ATPase.